MGRVRAALSGHAGTWRLRDDFATAVGFRLVCWLRLNVVPFSITQRLAALTGYSMPIFWWGMMLIMLVSVHWNLTPVSGRVSDMVFLDDSNPLTGFMLIDTAIWGEDGNFIDAVAHMILPAIVLGTIPLAVIVRMTRPRCWKCWAKIISAPRVPKVLPGCG